MDKLTKRQGAIMSAYTGILCGEFSDFHQYVEEIMERPVFTHEMGREEFSQKLQDVSRKDFLEIVAP